MDIFINQELKPLYKKHLYESIIARRNMSSFTYSYIKNELDDKYWHHLRLARIAYLTIQILKNNIKTH